MALSGWFSGAIVAVLVAKIAGFFLRIPDCDQMPVPCNWYKYAGIGAVIGAVTLPALVLNKIRQSVRDAERAAQQ